MKACSVTLLSLVTLLLLTSIITAWDDGISPDANYGADINCPPNQGDYPIRAHYIVVGGGAAGAVVATRLSENPNNIVLLLDGGGASHSSVGGTDYVAARYKVNGPGNVRFYKPYTRYDVPSYCYSAVADFPNSPTPSYPLQTTYAGTLNTHSRILGGNSVHNYLVWDRVTPYSINSWNVTGWSFNDALPFFKKSEDASNLNLGNAPYRGFDGPIRLNYAQAPDPLGEYIIQSCLNSNLGYTNDFNDPVNHLGCGHPQFNINDKGIRASSVNQYLAPALNRTNLIVRLNALVTKVLFNTNTVPKAIGVQYVIGGTTYTALASKEIVLSAGAFNTPKILLLSGIGPAAHLNSLGIPVIADLPVGKRMALHPVVFSYFKYNITSHNPYDISHAATEYAVNGTGIFASTGVPVVGKIKTKPSLPDMDAHIEVALGGYSEVGVAQFVSLLWGSKQNNGTITLTANDYKVAPKFTYTPLENQDDLNALVAILKTFRKLATTAPANRIFGEETQPGSAVQTDAQLKNYVRNGGSFATVTHLHGGAVMGNINDPNSVVDPRLRVKKVTGLRVADLSIVPGIFLGGPMANCIMFGERAAAFILADNA